MTIVYQILYLAFVLLMVAIVFITVYFIMLTIKNLYLNYKILKKHKKKFKLPAWIPYTIKNTRYIKIVDFVKWVIIDILRGKDKLRLWGIWAFTGYYGEGKTMGCVQFAKYLQKQYPHRDIKIFSNIHILGQVRRVENWEELLHLPKNSIFIYDESQADWSCNIGVNSFPEDFLRRITQCRKKQFAMFMTSPKFNRMNINLRESVNFVIECKNILQVDRWFKYTFYRAEDYEQYHENKLKLMLNKYLQMSFVISDKDYKLYNTVEEVETIKKEEVKLSKKETTDLNLVLKSFRNDLIREMELKIKNELKNVS